MEKKKILSALVLFSLLTIVLAPALALAQPPTECKIKDLSRMPAGLDCTNTCPYSNPDCGMCCLLNTLYNVTDWMFVVLIGIAVIFIIIGGFTFVTAGGSTEKTQSGRNYLLYAAVGILIGLLAKAIPAIVGMVAGG